MNQVFASHVPGGNTGLSEGGEGQGLSLRASRAPGTIPSTVNPPQRPARTTAAALGRAGRHRPRLRRAAPRDARRRRLRRSAIGRLLRSLARKVGTRRRRRHDREHRRRAGQAENGRRQAQRTAAARGLDAEDTSKPKPAETKQVAAARPAPKPQLSETPPPTGARAPKDTLVAGAQPIVSVELVREPLLRSEVSEPAPSNRRRRKRASSIETPR